MYLKISILSIILSVLILGSGCKKWRNNREPLTSEDHTLAEASFNDIFSYLLISASPGGELLRDSCFSFTTSGTGFPLTIEIDMGDKGCSGLFRYNTYGKIILTLSDSIKNENAVITATPDGLHIRGYRVDGNITITRASASDSGNPRYHVKVADAMITAIPDETAEDFSITWQCEYDYERIDIGEESLLTDDLYQITGSASGVNEEDRGYSATIIEPLKKYVDCRWPGSGKAKIVPDDLKERDLNYGDCSSSNCCDNEAMEDVKWTDKTVRMR